MSIHVFTFPLDEQLALVGLARCDIEHSLISTHALAIHTIETHQVVSSNLSLYFRVARGPMYTHAPKQFAVNMRAASMVAAAPVHHQPCSSVLGCLLSMLNEGC